LAGKKILVVDDEADAREVIGRLIALQGGGVLTAKSADEAICILKTHRPDILVSDIGILSSGLSETPAIALTAFVRAEDRRRAVLAGYQSHLTKPVDPGELIAVIAMLTKRRPNTEAMTDLKVGPWGTVTFLSYLGVI